MSFVAEQQDIDIVQSVYDWLATGSDADQPYIPGGEGAATETAHSSTPDNAGTYIVLPWWVPLAMGGIGITLFFLTRK